MSDQVAEQCSFECAQTRKKRENACLELVMPGQAPRMQLTTTRTSTEVVLTKYIPWVRFGIFHILIKIKLQISS